MDNSEEITNKDLQDSISDAPPELTLDVDDKLLVEFIDAYEQKAKGYFESDDIKLTQRRKRNRKYYFGKQLEDRDDIKLYGGQKKVLDNVIKEGEDNLRPLVLSRLPDIVITAGTKNDKNKQKTADAITKSAEAVLTPRKLKKILTRAFRDHPLDYTAVVKYRWEPNQGSRGDVVFENILAKNVIVDSTATENDQEKMKIIIHYVEKSLKEWIMLFPKKEEILKKYAEKKGHYDSDKEEKSLAYNIKLAEVWFDWSEKAEEFDPENPEYKFLSGLLWKLGSDILDKRKNPNWDWEGEEKLFYNNQPVPDEMIPQIAMLGNNLPGLETKKVFRNFFGKPRKPFIFAGFEQYGEMAYDATSRIEENLPMQDNYDYRLIQITRMIDGSQGKHVFSTLSGLKKETVREMDLDDPNEDIVVDGDLRQVHTYLQKEQPSREMYGDLVRNRDRIMEKLHLSGAVRGEIESDTATTNQIARESSFSSADELADATVVDITIQMVEATVHMMKLRYTEEHFEALLGKIGEESLDRLAYDMIEDGMEVQVTASGTDKLKRERQAKEEAALGFIDPLSFFKDTGRIDAEDRAEKLFLFQTQPELYYKKYVQKEEIPDIAEEIRMRNEQAMTQQPQGGMAQPTQKPSPGNTQDMPVTPQGSPRSLMGRGVDAISSMFGG